MALENLSKVAGRLERDIQEWCSHVPQSKVSLVSFLCHSQT